MISPFDARPIIVAVAGPNGAGKSTFHAVYLAPAALRFVNADDLARELAVDAREGAHLANELRKTLVEQGESFVFETVLSDPVGDKVEFLRKAAAEKGYTVVLCYIGVDSVEVSQQRVAMRVLQGGHDVPDDKLIARFPRTQANLTRAIHSLPHVLVYDNSDLTSPFQQVAEFQDGKPVSLRPSLPPWLAWK
ncbi:MAG TPA: zeta toxin family protein [Myxococcales bacterium]|nr:zeta toxin family protein [Myxococcales bacterium]